MDFYAHHRAFEEQEDAPAHPGWEEVDRHKGPQPYWLHELLADSGVPFSAQVETFPGHHQLFNVVYVPPAYLEQAKGLIRAFEDPSNFVLSEHEELAQPLELLTCAQCGEEFDAEYGACPFCFPEEVEG